jgi:hypothetical protein
MLEFWFSSSYQELGFDGVVDLGVSTFSLLVDNAAVSLFTWSDLFSKRRSASSLQAIHLALDVQLTYEDCTRCGEQSAILFSYFHAGWRLVALVFVLPVWCSASYNPFQYSFDLPMLNWSHVWHQSGPNATGLLMACYHCLLSLLVIFLVLGCCNMQVHV